MKNKILFLLLLCLSNWHITAAQFIGGAADGYDETSAESATNIYAGASED